jgi:hypothetical protein
MIQGRRSTKPSLSPDGDEDGEQGPSRVLESYGLRGEQWRRSIKCRHHRSEPLVMTLLGTSYALDKAGSSMLVHS